MFIYFVAGLFYCTLIYSRVYLCGSICKIPVPLVQSNISLYVCIHLYDTGYVGSFHILTSGIMGSVNMSRQIKIIKILQFAFFEKKKMNESYQNEIKVWFNFLDELL